MSPKAKRVVKRTASQEQEQPDGDQKATSTLKRPKRELEEQHQETHEGNSIAGKKELDKMYSALKYLDKKGKTHPLAHYNGLNSKKEKQEFYSKFLKDKKFEFVAVDATTEMKTSNSNESFKGWVTKWQVADFEKIPVGHPLLEAKLASLPSRAHPIQEWRDAGEMEYYYESNQMERNEETMSHGIRVQGHGTAQPRAVESLLQGLPASSSGPHKAIEDGDAPDKDGEEDVKDEEEEDEEEKKSAILEEWNELKGKLQKSTRSMGDLCMEAQTIQRALGHKRHLEGLAKKKTLRRTWQCLNLPSRGHSRPWGS